MYRARLAVALVLALLLSAGAAGIAWGAPDAPRASSDTDASTRLRKAVEPAGILVHERRLQSIANANDGTRASGTPGYDASADYVADKLRSAGYDVTVQPFTFPFFQETGPSTFERLSPSARTYERESEYAVMGYSGSGDVSAQVQPVDVQIPPAPTPSSTSGCEDSDFAGFPAGSVALIQRGTCTFGEKVQNAEEAGAVAAIVFNEGQEGRTDVVNGTLGAPANIPAVDTTFAIGEELYNLASNGGTTVHIVTQTISETRQTTNVIADTKKGRADRTVVVGAHLDSVTEGPGINDNGSGTSAILEIALQMAELDFEPRNRVRFAFWGAEELGLLGSEHYVQSLSQKQLDDIALNLNFDMVASPNYVRFVYDGDGSATPENPDDAGPAGSAQIEDVFNDYFAGQGLQTDPTAFDGRSDYGPFIAVGIPAGGLFSGAEGIKTEEQAAIYGGQAGVAYDPCYHQACDDISNLNVRGLDELSDGAAHATLTFARQRTLFASANQSLGTQSSRTLYERFKGPEARR